MCGRPKTKLRERSLIRTARKLFRVNASICLHFNPNFDWDWAIHQWIHDKRKHKHAQHVSFSIVSVPTQNGIKFVNILFSVVSCVPFVFGRISILVEIWLICCACSGQNEWYEKCVSARVFAHQLVMCKYHCWLTYQTLSKWQITHSQSDRNLMSAHMSCQSRWIPH